VSKIDVVGLSITDEARKGLCEHEDCVIIGRGEGNRCWGEVSEKGNVFS